MAGTSERYDGRGPIQRRLLELLSGYTTGSFQTSIATNSPLGPGTIRVRAVEENGKTSVLAGEAVTEWLGSQPGVEEVAWRIPYVHVRFETDVLREWVNEGTRAGESGRGHEGDGREAVIGAAGLETGRPRSLEEFRRTALARAAGALMGSRGFQVSLRESSEESAWIELPPASPATAINIAGVDVKNGPMRARHGGTILVADLVADVRRGSLSLGELEPEPEEAEALGEALVTFLLARVERERRVVLDDRAIRGGALELGTILLAARLASSRAEGVQRGVRAGGAEGGGSGGSEAEGVVSENGADESVRALASHVEWFSGVAARAAAQLEPALLIRYAVSLADLIGEASGPLAPEDGIWEASAHALRGALALAGIDPSGPEA
ncbi:MAG TPA: hypothetical protein VGX16_05205 [Solirubrobacteraceae bacterium]|jgi:hypothetical protein|nr:hypothetical protein [Solirubrobacteraceae bacterium]